jgi:DNA-binding transcriptional LysR family regulator
VDINLIRTFLTIVDTGNFNRAGEILNVSQSTVSTRIKSLEFTLGQPLFDRGKSGASLSMAGRYFLKHAQALLRTWEQARLDVALPARFEGTLAIGGQFTLWDNLLLKWIPWLTSAMPDLAIKTELGLSDSIMRMLLDGMIDIGVMYTPQNRPGLAIEELMSEQLVLVSTAENTKEPGEVGFVYVDWGPEFQSHFVGTFPDMEPPALTMSHGPMGLLHILNVGGSGYFPLRSVRRLIDDQKLFLPKGVKSFSRPIFAVYGNDRINDQRFKTALQGLRHLASIESNHEEHP